MGELACEDCHGIAFRLGDGGRIYCAGCDYDATGDNGLMIDLWWVESETNPTRTTLEANHE